MRKRFEMQNQVGEGAGDGSSNKERGIELVDGERNKNVCQVAIYNIKWCYIIKTKDTLKPSQTCRPLPFKQLHLSAIPEHLSDWNTPVLQTPLWSTIHKLRRSHSSLLSCQLQWCMSALALKILPSRNKSKCKKENVKYHVFLLSAKIN